MPSASNRVSFQPTPVYSRLPRDDETYVMRAFAKHSSHCEHCADPYYVHRSGGTLCSKGHRRAIDVAQYVYNKRGQAYSVVDREGSQRVQIEIPASCDAVRSLLKAMERGLQIRQQATATSQDRTYYVQDRPVSVHHHRASKKPSADSAKVPSTHRAHSRKTSDLSRGSYESDLSDRYYESRQPVYYQYTPQLTTAEKEYYYR